MASLNVQYDLVKAEDIPRAFEIETAGFPEDEAASLSSLENRQWNAGDFFLGAYLPSEPRQLIGYTCATLTPSPTLTHDSMSTHDPAGGYVAIHSVCVDGAYLRKGVASGLLKEYVARLEKAGKVKGARLIAHEELIPLYQRAGFELVGKSEVVHGPREWFELKVDFPTSSSSSSSSAAAAPVPAEEPEEDEGPNVRSPGLPLSRFTRQSSSSSSNGLSSLVDPSTGLNTADLYCPRPECRCLLLRRGTGKLVRSHPSDFDLPALPRPLGASAPAPSSYSSAYWTVPSPLSFENIGFSRNALPPSASSSSPAPTAAAGGGTIKYLTCADCDHGPLGWHDTEGRDLGLEVQAENEARTAGAGGGVAEKGEKEDVVPQVRRGREFLLAVERVRYKV
ncbi:hypothetical protein JCM6882_008412 [Rhodosporidiobolus microsporus]